MEGTEEGNIKKGYLNSEYSNYSNDLGVYSDLDEEEEFGEESFSNEGDYLENNFDEGIGMEGSEPKPMGGIYALFDAVRRTPRTTKVSNLNKTELGDLGISVRESMRIALLAKTFHHPIFARFFLDQAGIISDSAMSKEGWFTELFVTSKRYASRESSSKVDNLPKFEKGKWKMFGKNKKE